MAIAIKLGGSPVTSGWRFLCGTIRYLGEYNFFEWECKFHYSNRTKTLESICVYNNSGTLIREINIETTLVNITRVFDRIRIKRNFRLIVKCMNLITVPCCNYSPYTKGVDYWGYYNGQEGNTDLIPNQRVPLYNTGVIVDSVTIGGAYNRYTFVGKYIGLFIGENHISYGRKYSVLVYSQNTILNDKNFRQMNSLDGVRIDEIFRDTVV